MAGKTKKNKDCFRILFQSMNPQLFRATFIGYLYEIAQKHQVVLLTGEIDSYTKRILGDKNLFPGLEKIIFFESAFNGDVFRKNYRLCRKLKMTVQDYSPDIVITHTDIWPADMYLLRFAKKAGAITVAIQAGFKIAGERKLYLWSCLMNSYIKMPRFLSFPVRLFLVKIKKYIGHFFYYWILPFMAGEMPFLGKTSFIFWDECSGLRDADYSAIFSKRDYDLCVKEGVNPEKLFVLGHPLEHKSTKNFFEKVYFSKNKEKPSQTRQCGGNEAGGENLKTLTIMWPDEKIGFKNGDYSLISEKEMRENRVKIVKLISEKLADWKIFIKPHPAVKNVLKIKEFLGPISDNVSIVDPSEPADKYIEMSSVVVGTPPPSTTLFTASLQCPDKIILSLDLAREFLGDCYRDFNGIEYIDIEEKLINILDLIRDDKYHKKHSVGSYSDFSDANKLLDYIYTNHQKTN
jgi:hypothetical protein